MTFFNFFESQVTFLIFCTVWLYSLLLSKKSFLVLFVKLKYQASQKALFKTLKTSTSVSVHPNTE